MSNALKYTDRDVRENPDFYGRVHNYLVDYSGDFQFLVDCKMRIMSGIELPVGMVRGVLNCMRIDPRVTNLPEPLVYEECDFDADVIPMRQGYGRGPTKQKIARRDCQIEEYHTHTFKDWEYLNFCPGKYEYDRDIYDLPATIHSEYTAIKAKSPSVFRIHKVGRAMFQWFPNRHEAGFYREPQPIVWTHCKFPRYLRDGILLNNQMLAELLNDDNEQYFWCERCYYDG